MRESEPSRCRVHTKISRGTTVVTANTADAACWRELGRGEVAIKIHRRGSVARGLQEKVGASDRGSSCDISRCSSTEPQRRDQGERSEDRLGAVVQQWSARAREER